MTAPVTTKPVTFRYKIVDHRDSNGREVTQHELTWGEFPVGYCQFYGQGRVLLDGSDGRKAQMDVPNFPIHGATTVEEAFSVWEAKCSMEVQRKIKEINDKNRELALPGSEKYHETKSLIV